MAAQGPPSPERDSAIAFSWVWGSILPFEGVGNSSSRQLHRLLPFVPPFLRDGGAQIILLHVRRPSDTGDGVALPDWLAAATAELAAEGVTASVLERMGSHTAGTIREVVRESGHSLAPRCHLWFRARAAQLPLRGALVVLATCSRRGRTVAMRRRRRILRVRRRCRL